MSCREWMASISTSSQGCDRARTTSRKAAKEERGCICRASSWSSGLCFAPPHLISFSACDAEPEEEVLLRDARRRHACSHNTPSTHITDPRQARAQS